METKLIETLKQIMDLSLSALDQARNERQRTLEKFKLLQGNFGTVSRRKKLPPGLREFRPGYFQGRKVVNGKRITVYGATPEETAEELEKAVHAAELATTPAQKLSPNRVSYGEWLQIWRDTYKAPKLAASSLFQIDNIVKNHIPKWLKDLSLPNLSPILVQRALNEVLTDRMREYAYTIYSDSLRWAADLEYIPDIMRHVPAFKAERIPGKPLPLEIQTAFLKLVDSLANKAFGKLFHFLLLSGARPGEPQHMSIADFDYANNRVHIPGTKNKYSDRFIPFLPEIHELVDNWLPSVSGRPFPFTANYINKQMKTLLPDYTPKDLRHTFATRCKECGIPTDVYKQWLGHSKRSTVAETTYTHYENVNLIEAKKFTLYPVGLLDLNKPEK